MGYITDDGVYHEGSPSLPDMVVERSVNWKQGDHDRQRQDHKVDLIRPYLPSGEPNPEFIAMYPVESQEVYHFIKSDQEIAEER